MNRSEPVLLSTPQRWEEVRQLLQEHPEWMDNLRRRVERFRAAPFESVVDKPEPPPGGEIHDYASLSKYNWPDPDKPDGLPWINRDGERNPVADLYDSPRLVRFCLGVTTLIGFSKLTGDESSAREAGLRLRHWFLNPATRMNPHMRHAQFVPGRQNGSSWGVIDSHFFCELLEAVRCFDFNPEWRPEHLEGVRKWFREYLDWLTGDPQPLEEEKSPNNHGLWYDAQCLACQVFLGELDAAKQRIREKSLPRLAGHLEPDGAMPRELARTLSMTYCHFNLTGWGWVAGYGKQLGIDVWNAPGGQGGATLSLALHKVLPGFLGKEKWSHQQIGPAPRDIELCRLFALLRDVESDPELSRYLDEAHTSPVWRLPCFMTDDDWQQAATRRETED